MNYGRYIAQLVVFDRSTPIPEPISMIHSCSKSTHGSIFVCRTLLALVLGLAVGCRATDTAPRTADTPVVVDVSLATFIRDNYTKREALIPMRDGVKLFTAIYEPKDGSTPHPFMMIRTPYSVGPYGEDKFRTSLGPSEAFVRLPNDGQGGFIFVYQDVRGTHMSEGELVNMTPHVAVKDSPSDIDESTDTYDTIEWLLKNVPNNNGKVGQWGISYPGFYAAAGMIDAHPALIAVSPQAPIADWWFDDFHHHGAFFLPHSFNFLSSFGQPRPVPVTDHGKRFDHGTPDGYQFFLDLGPLSNANDRHFKGEIAFWNDIVAHPNYDEFWQARNLLPHLKNTAPAVMTVGGWFDAEDLYGPLTIYREIEKNNPDDYNVLVMGPWQHGGWSRSDGDRLGNITFGGKQSEWYRAEVELKFFNHFLKGSGDQRPAEATIFETGANQWRTFDRWPPANVQPREVFLAANGELSVESPVSGADDFDLFISDPAKPVPFTEAIAIGMTREYMTDDQRFAARRPDVLAYQTPVLENDITIAGPITAELWVSTSQADADWVVKVIDVFPPDAPDHDGLPAGRRMGGYQMMVRSEVMRGRFRNSYEKPEPFISGQPTLVRVPLQDVLHTFKKGHRAMVQIQSTWFPLVDRNPQKWVDNIFEAKAEDFVKAEHRVFRSSEHPSRIVFGELNSD